MKAPMRATEFEFRYRSLLNLVHFWLAFQVYALDHVNVVQAVVAWTTGLGNLRARILARIFFALGALLVGLAAAIRTWAAAYLRSDIVHDMQLHVETLVADGPYRYLRNPLYLGTLLLTVGLGFLASRLGFVILAGGAAMRILRLIGREEGELADAQGEKFREYCRRVPRLLPAFSPRVPAGAVEPRWGQAFRGEAFMWCCLLAMIAFTVTLRIKWALVGIGAAVAVWFLLNVVRMARRRTRSS
jgi:protein-S-isoprenylcysteine O-methyltransferase Ste14